MSDFMREARARALAESFALREDVPLEDQPIARLPVDELSARRAAAWAL